MRITQGTFSYLPDFTDEQIEAQVRYCFDNGWAFSIEYTDDPHPRNSYWEMWRLPMFDLHDLNEAMEQIDECRKAFPDRYIKLNGYDRTKGKQTRALCNGPRMNRDFLSSALRRRTAAFSTPFDQGANRRTNAWGFSCKNWTQIP